MPRSVSDAIYGRVQGAEYDTDEQLWLVPCDQMLNISFNFGGVNFPIHPLDTVSADFNMTDSSGKTMCVGTVSFALFVTLAPLLTVFCTVVPANYYRVQSLGVLRYYS